jgi:hypothetical protein
MAAVIVVFDGLLNDLDGLGDPDDLGRPRDGAREFLAALREWADVVIVTHRDPALVRAWLVAYDMPETHAQNEHPPVLVTIGPRVLRFDGRFEGLAERVRTFGTDTERAAPGPEARG